MNVVTIINVSLRRKQQQQHTRAQMNLFSLNQQTWVEFEQSMIFEQMFILLGNMHLSVLIIMIVLACFYETTMGNMLSMNFWM